MSIWWTFLNKVRNWWRPRYEVIEKSVGETPLQAIERFRASESGRRVIARGGYDPAARVPLAYAGRLDPMASGKLLVLIGGECKKQTEYHQLDKEYVFELLLGASTDTGDLLGLSTVTLCHNYPNELMSNPREVILNYVGETVFPYPIFSSKPVQGKPLFLWALENRLDEIEIPQSHSEIHYIEIESSRTISGANLWNHIQQKLALLPTVTEESKKLGADFRRADILEKWKQQLDAHRETEFPLITIRCGASAGLYIRTLAEQIANDWGCRGLAYSIHRTKIFKTTRIGKWTSFSKEI